MAMAQEKVMDMPINYIGNYYEAFLQKHKPSTAINYKTDLCLFFKKIYNKEPIHVTFDDIRGTTMLDAISYYNWLGEDVDVKGETKPRYKNASINRKLNAVKSFLRFLNGDFEDIDDRIFRTCDSKDTELDADSYDSLEWTEAIEIWEYAQDNFDEESNQLSMLFKLASITSIRLDALLKSVWEKDWFIKKEGNIEIHYIEVIDKSKLHKKPISSSFYKELRDKLGTTGELFPTLYDKKVGKYLKQTLIALSFDSRRNIKFHSFKKTGVMRALAKTGNMYKAKEQGNHSSINTSEKYYLKYKECLVDMVSFTMDEDADDKEFEEYSREELLKAIGQISDGAKFELLRILKG